MPDAPTPRARIVWNQATRGVAVTPSDTVPLSPSPSRWLYVGGAGNLAVKLEGDTANAVTLTAVPVGALLPLSAVYVMATNTTATLIVALY